MREKLRTTLIINNAHFVQEKVCFNQKVGFQLIRNKQNLLAFEIRRVLVHRRINQQKKIQVLQTRQVFFHLNVEGLKCGPKKHQAANKLELYN